MKVDLGLKNGKLSEEVLTAPANRNGMLDLLRALAILGVFVSHYKERWLPAGGIGVSIFFCLSGFLIAQQLLPPTSTVGYFLVRRIFRIYPAYITVCLLNLVLSEWLGPPIYKETASIFFNLLTAFKMPDSWMGYCVGVFWTLQIELWFYLLIPLLIKTAARRFLKVIIPILIVISLGLKCLKILQVITIPNYALFQCFLWMDNLLYGCYVAVLLNQAKFPHSMSRHRRAKKIALVIGSFCVIFWIAVVGRSTPDFFPFESTVTSFLTAVIIFNSVKSNIFTGVPLRVISAISLLAYSVYLVHPFPLDYYRLVEPRFQLPQAALKGLIFCFGFLFTLVIHFAVEVPGIRLGRVFYKLIRSEAPFK